MSASIIAQIQNQVCYSLRLQILYYFQQFIIITRIERIINQISDFMSSFFYNLIFQYRSRINFRSHQQYIFSILLDLSNRQCHFLFSGIQQFQIQRHIVFFCYRFSIYFINKHTSVYPKGTGRGIRINRLDNQSIFSSRYPFCVFKFNDSQSSESIGIDVPILLNAMIDTICP